MGGAGLAGLVGVAAGDNLADHNAARGQGPGSRRARKPTQHTMALTYTHIVIGRWVG